MSPAPIVNIIRPQLTPEEREARLEELKRAVGEFWLAVERSGANEKREAET